MPWPSTRNSKLSSPATRRPTSAAAAQLAGARACGSAVATTSGAPTVRAVVSRCSSHAYQVTPTPQRRRAGTAVSFRVVVARTAARQLAGRLPESVAWACVELIFGALAEDPHRVGAPLRKPFDNQWRARRGEYRARYRSGRRSVRNLLQGCRQLTDERSSTASAAGWVGLRGVQSSMLTQALVIYNI